jgi:hypothetical protein
MTMTRRVLRGVAAVGLGAAALLLGAAGSAQASPTHVAIVIAGDKTACVAFTSGMTGDDVLRKVASVHYRRDGLIDQIDGSPADLQSDATHFWAYWHNTGGGWTFSSLGAGSYHPQPGTVEGWAYGNTARPPAASYASICHDSAPPPAPPASHPSSKAPTTAHAPAPTRAPAPTGPAASNSAAIATGGPTGAARTTAAPTTTAAASPHRRLPSSHEATSPTAAGRPSTVHAAVPGHPEPSTSPVAADQRKSSGSSALPAVSTAVAIAAAGAIGGVAFWRMRRQGGG